MSSNYPLINITMSKLSSAKGKIYRGSTINAYSRQSIPTIPSEVETILFKKPKNISSIVNTNFFEVQGDNLKLSFKNGIIDNHSLHQNQSNPIIKPIKHRNHITPAERFIYNDIQKYYPGPGDYNPTHIPKSLRYNCLFEAPLMITELTDFNPGPGTYNISSPLNTQANVYISPASRFRKKRIEEYKKTVGPGSYNVSYDLGSQGKDKLSSFFMKSDSNTKVNQEEEIMKHVDIHDNFIAKQDNHNHNDSNKNNKAKRNKVVIRNFEDIKEEIIQRKLLDNELIMNDKGKENSLPIKFNTNDYNTKNKDNSDNYDDFKPDPKKLKGVTFNPLPVKHSNSNKLNHVPGPCYYDLPIINRKEFNSNMNNIWLGR